MNCKNCNDEIPPFADDSLLGDGFCTEKCRIKASEKVVEKCYIEDCKNSHLPGGYFCSQGCKDKYWKEGVAGERKPRSVAEMQEWLRGMAGKSIPNYSELSLPELQELRDSACNWLKENMNHLRFEEANKRYMAIEDEIWAKGVTGIFGIKNE